MNAIEVIDVCKKFKQKGKYVKALEHMNLKVSEGELYGFLGPNGAGKSTTIKVVMDLIRGDYGETKIFGIDSRDIKARQNVGYLPENPVFMDNLTGRDIMLFSAMANGISKKDALNKMEEILERLDLIEAIDRPVRKYSKGMIQRLGFGSIILHKPRLMILDEPMSGLDPMGRYKFKEIMNELSKDGITIFFSSHIIPDMEDICSKVGIIKQGSFLKEISRRELKLMTTSKIKIIYKGGYLDNCKICKLEEGIFEIETDKNDFFTFLEKIKASSWEIVSIDSVKTDLETLFVQLSEYSGKVEESLDA